MNKKNENKIFENIKFQMVCSSCNKHGFIGQIRSTISEAEKDQDEHLSTYANHNIRLVHRDSLSTDIKPKEAYCSRGDFSGSVAGALAHQTSHPEHIIIYL